MQSDGTKMKKVFMAQRIEVFRGTILKRSSILFLFFFCHRLTLFRSSSAKVSLIWAVMKACDRSAFSIKERDTISVKMLCKGVRGRTPGRSVSLGNFVESPPSHKWLLLPLHLSSYSIELEKNSN